MGKSNSKPFTCGDVDKSKLMGCAKIMCKKHGVDTCKQLPLWVRVCGFPENGSFSVAKIQQLEEDLAIYEGMKGTSKIDWKAFRMWKSETEKRWSLEEKGRKRRGEETSQGRAHPQKELGLLPVSAAHPRSRNQQPVEPDREVRGQLAAAEPTMPCPGSAPPPYGQSVPAPAQSMPDPRAHQSTQTIEVMEVPESREPEAAGITAAWTPEDLRSFAKDLPDLDPQGGAPFGEALVLIADVCKLSLREIRILTIYGIQLKWGQVQGDWPESDLRFDWTWGSVYRDHVERLCERMRATFPAVTRLAVVGYCVQKRGEMVADYFVRLEKVFEENVGRAKSRNYDFTEDLLKKYFLEGMHEPIRSQIRERCTDVESLSVVRQHAVHHERKLREAEEKKEKARVLLTDRWMKAEIRALQGGGGRRGNAGLRDGGCWTCGDPDHWARDCDGPRSGAPLCLTYMEEADSRGW